MPSLREWPILKERSPASCGPSRHLRFEPLEQCALLTVFGPVTNFDVLGVGPHSVATADFNNDGKIDLVTANYESANVSVMLGNGNGTFGPVRNFGAGIFPDELDVGDFNGDGKVDLAVPGGLGETVSILIGNGDGTFQERTILSAGPGAMTVDIGDLNQDGKPDLAVANNTAGSVSIILGDGDGTFQPRQDYSTGSPSATHVALADLNGDTKPDVVAVKYGTGTLSVFLGNGDGTLQGAVSYPVGANPESVAAGDFNGDGELDLATANFGTHDVSVLLGKGDGTFQSSTSYPADIRAQSVAVADFDQDGKADLVTANYGADNLSLFLGNGNGTFQPARNYPVGAGPFYLAIADFNGDPLPDVVVANRFSNSVSILLNKSNVAPMAANDGPYFVAEDGMLSVPAFGVLANDTDVDATTLTATLVSGPNSGLLTLNPDGSFSYTPNPNFNGSDSFTYQASDGSLNSNVATVSITVTEVNDAPIGIDDGLPGVAEDAGPRLITFESLLANDSKGPPNESGQTLTITSVGNAVGGTVRIVGTQVQPASFMGLGDLPGGNIGGSGQDVSDDGSTVVGWSASEIASAQAFRWSGDGLVGLGPFAVGTSHSVAQAVSGDGSVIVGGTFNFLGLEEAFRWSGGVVVPLGDLPGGPPSGPFRSRAFAVSADGSVIVGLGASDLGIEAFRWSGGAMVGLGDLAGGLFESTALDVSADGSTVVGRGTSAAGVEAFRWNSSGGMLGLGDLPGGNFRSIANSISADGSTIVGVGTPATGGHQAFRWTSAGGMIGLGYLPSGGFSSEAFDASADGSIIVGTGQGSLGESRAFIWDESRGMRTLQSMLTIDYGLDLTGWELRMAHGISADGRVIVGWGHHNGQTEPWVARLGGASGGNAIEFSPAADFNGTASFTYTLQDNGTTNGLPDPKTATAAVSFTITEVNDAPTAVNDVLSTIDEDSGPRTINFAALLGNDSTGPANESNQTLTITIVSNAAGGTVSLVGTDVVFTPFRNFHGPASFVYVVQDNGTTDGVLDPRISFGTVSFTVTPQNDAPVIESLVNSSPDCGEATEGQAVTVSATYLDVDAGDTHIALINWGDGQETTGTVNSADGTVSGVHSYAAGGIYMITLTLTDEHGALDIASTQAVIGGAGVHNGELQIIGTDGNDQVTINKLGSRLNVHADFFPESAFRSFSLTEVTRILVLLCGGDDHATIAGNVAMTAVLDGGPGCDYLQGGGGANILLGGEGDDVLMGRAARDLIFGGLGADQLVGNGGDDLLIAGTTSYDDVLINEQALLTLLAEWTSSRSYAQRVANLRNSAGPVLAGTGLSLQMGITVFDDGDWDTLTGSAQLDWFFFDELLDRVSDRKVNEQAN